jgi:hypothetical protein
MWAPTRARSHRHDLAVPQNATGIAERTELEREGKPCLRRPITADDLDILGKEGQKARACEIAR